VPITIVFGSNAATQAVSLLFADNPFSFCKPLFTGIGKFWIVVERCRNTGWKYAVFCQELSQFYSKQFLPWSKSY